MSATSKIVHGAAALTLLAGVPLVAASPAQAANEPFTVTLTPATARVATTGCQLFTATVLDDPAENDATKNVADPVANTVVDVVITEPADAGGAQDVDFCTAAAPGAATPATPSDASTDTAAGTTTDRAEFTTASNGVVRFGVSATTATATAITIRVFVESDNDDVYEAGEPTDTSTLTISAGGADAVTTVTATPASETTFPGETRTITATLTNSAGDPVPGVTPHYDVTGGPDAAVGPTTCTVSNQAGQSTCTFTSGPTAGTDTIVVYVQQSDGTTPGPDAAEPKATVTRVIRAFLSGYQVDLTCDGTAGRNTSAEDCVNLVSDATTVWTATVTVPDGGDAGKNRDPAPDGTVIVFTEDGAGATLNRYEATTVNGVATATLTESTPTNGERIVVTATIRGQSATGDPGDGEITTDSGTLTYTVLPTAARTLVLTPETSTSRAQTTTQTFTATVTDVSGGPVAGVEVTFTESGTGTFRNGAGTVVATTDATGRVTAEITSTEAGTQTVRAEITGFGTSRRGSGASDDTCEQAGGSCADTSTHTWTTPPQTTATVSMGVNVARITAGNAPELAGVVRDTNDKVIAGRTVTILVRPYGSSEFSQLLTTTTDADGEYAVLVRPQVQSSYEARVDGVTSPMTTVFVNARITIDSPEHASRLLSPVVVYGRHLPTTAPVRVGVATLANGRFVYRTQGTTGEGGGFVIPAHLPRGTYALVVYTSARAGVGPGAKSVLITVE